MIYDKIEHEAICLLKQIDRRAHERYTTAALLEHLHGRPPQEETNAARTKSKKHEVRRR
jgi:hypothetical protein